ncbi:MAG: Rid family detoxifying hydrolase [Acidimicrobiia bacterium]|nr:Rid family detoxifying hydrolase [Acidimicrobiia bacterium]
MARESVEVVGRTLGPYSPAVRAGGLVFVAGQIGWDFDAGALVGGGVEAEMSAALANLADVLAAAGCTAADVVKTTVFVTDITAGPAVNPVYAEFFGADPPARSFVQVSALPAGALVEIEAVAACPPTDVGT